MSPFRQLPIQAPWYSQAVSWFCAHVCKHALHNLVLIIPLWRRTASLLKTNHTMKISVLARTTNRQDQFCLTAITKTCCRSVSSQLLFACLQVGYSAILFYGYVGLIGLMLYACLRWWFKSKVSLAQVWCIYGKPWFAWLWRACSACVSCLGLWWSKGC